MTNKSKEYKMLPEIEWTPEDKACEVLHGIDFTTEKDMLQAVVNVANLIRNATHRNAELADKLVEAVMEELELLNDKEELVRTGVPTWIGLNDETVRESLTTIINKITNDGI